MSLSNSLKTELLEIKLPTSCCRKAFLSGVIHGSGDLILVNKHLEVKIEHQNRPLIDRCIEHISSLIKFQPTIYKKVKKRSLGDITYYGIHLSAEDSEKLLNVLNINSPVSIMTGEDTEYINKTCCKASFIRGLYLSAGTVTFPDEEVTANSKSKGYSLELLIGNENVADKVFNILSDSGIEPKMRQRKNVTSLYYKGGDALGDFLAYIGATKSFFALQDILVSRSVSNDVNRRMNCDSANLERAMEAANRQNDAVTLIRDTIGLSALEESLRVVAEARLNYPLESMTELAHYIPNAPGKSGMNHRMKKIMDIAKDIQNGIIKKK